MSRRRVLLFLLIVFGLAQFLRPDRTVVGHAPTSDLIAMTAPGADVGRLLRVACYDCHSDSAAYPWYASITPVNFWLQHHVNEGREEFNMSAWGEHTAKWRHHKASEARHELQEGEMPLSSYTWMHGEAKLSEAERKQLIDYFSGLMATAGR